jgi:hypothetical protein
MTSGRSRPTVFGLIGGTIGFQTSPLVRLVICGGGDGGF